MYLYFLDKDTEHMMHLMYKQSFDKRHGKLLIRIGKVLIRNVKA